MKAHFTYSFCLLLLVPVVSIGMADIFDDISSAFKTGNAREIAKFFNSSVELTIDNKENVYSKTQAELVLKEFFANNPVNSFTVMHRGSSKGPLYAIGTLETSNGSYRTYIFVAKMGDKYVIQEIRLEKE